MTGVVARELKEKNVSWEIGHGGSQLMYDNGSRMAGHLGFQLTGVQNLAPLLTLY